MVWYNANDAGWREIGVILMAWHKYNAKSKIVDNITFQSKKEADRYVELKLLEEVGEICGLKLQPKFMLQDGFRNNLGKKIRDITWTADFRYFEGGEEIVEDVKGVLTQATGIRHKLFMFRYPQYVLRIT